MTSKIKEHALYQYYFQSCVFSSIKLNLFFVNNVWILVDLKLYHKIFTQFSNVF